MKKPLYTLLLISFAACARTPPVVRPAPISIPLPMPQIIVPAPEPEPHPPGRVPPPGRYLPGFDALHYDISLTLPDTGAAIDARATVLLAVEADAPDALRLDLVGLLATRVRVERNGAWSTARFHQDDGRLFVALPPGTRADTIRVEVSYRGTPDDGLIIRDNLHGARGAFGDNWPDRARFWFPSIDHPSDKATVSFNVRAPDGWQVVANGLRVDPSGTPLAPSTAASASTPPNGVWHWRIEQPVPTYLMVIGATPFRVIPIDPCADGGRLPGRADGCVPTDIWAFPQDSAPAARVFRRAGDMLEFYADLIAPHPYPRLAHVQSATRFGGMENAGAIFYSETGVSRGTMGEGTVAHEIAHQWFGDAVTPARWSDLWLSEGFATYFGALYFEHADGDAPFREMLASSWNGYLSSNVKDIPVVDTTATPGNDLLELLNANSYNKGGAVLAMLRDVVGDSAFFASMREYYRRHAPGNATTADLVRAVEDVSGRELDWFFEQWLYRPGHPMLRGSQRWDAARREAVVTVEQLQPQNWPVFRVPLDIEVATPAGNVRRRVELDARRQEFRIPVTAAPTAVTLDPDSRVLKTIVP